MESFFRFISYADYYENIEEQKQKDMKTIYGEDEA